MAKPGSAGAQTLPSSQPTDGGSRAGREEKLRTIVHLALEICSRNTNSRDMVLWRLVGLESKNGQSNQRGGVPVTCGEWVCTTRPLRQKQSKQFEGLPSHERSARGQKITEFSSQDRGQVANTSLACTHPRRRETLRSCRCSIPLTGSAALRLPPAVHSALPATPSQQVLVCSHASPAIAAGWPEGGSALRSSCSTALWLLPTHEAHLTWQWRQVL